VQQLLLMRRGLLSLLQGYVLQSQAAGESHGAGSGYLGQEPGVTRATRVPVAAMVELGVEVSVPAMVATMPPSTTGIMGYRRRRQLPPVVVARGYVTPTRVHQYM
jgi:hypothetical protein